PLTACLETHANQRKGNLMNKASLVTFLVFTSCILSFAQDAAYYKAIQQKSSNQVRPEQFKKMEEDALKNYSQAEAYRQLATSFGNTTEKVWAVIYGEAYCNLSADPEPTAQIGSLVYRWYDQSLSKSGNNLSVDLTENAQGIPSQAPFESVFEQS